MDTVLLILEDAFWSMLAALGFALLFNIPKQALPGCLLTGAVGHSIRAFLIEIGVEIELATLAGAVAVGFIALGLARYWKLPAPIFAIPGAIPMVPGAFAYRTMIGLIEISIGAANSDLLLQTVVNGVKTGLILGAIAIGITSPSLLFDRHKPVV